MNEGEDPIIHIFCTSHCTLFQIDSLKQGKYGENCEEVALVLETSFLVQIVIIAYTTTI